MQCQTPCRYRALRRIIGIVPLAWVLVSGCGGGSSGPELAPVKGIVLYDGQPVEGCVVEFLKAGSPTRSMGFTDESGQFELTSFAPGDGAPVGTNQVIVFKRTKPTHTASVTPEAVSLETISDPNERRLASMTNSVDQKLAAASLATGKGAQKQRDLLPPKYADAGTSDLEFEVTSGGPNDFQIVLTD